MKYYAVKKGRNPGVYTTWDEAKKEVDGFSGAEFKSFKTLAEANSFLEATTITNSGERGLLAYVDGSFNAKTKVYGYGVVLLEGGTPIKQIYGKGDHQDYVGMRNVAGEIIGSEVAIKYAVDNGYDEIAIYYDYMGIEKWADGSWQANKPGTKRYQELIAHYADQIAISFIKVLAHSGDTYNEMADQLAKKAAGIK